MFFDYKGKTVTVSAFLGSRYRPAYTSVVVNNVCNKRLTIYKESVVSSIGKTLGMNEIHIGYDYFDRRFIIKGDDEQFATNLLTPTIQDRLLSLYSHHVRLVLDHGDLKVKVP